MPRVTATSTLRLSVAAVASVLASALAWASPARAQEPPAPRAFVLRAVRVPGPPVIDGTVNDDEWAGAATVDTFVQFEPRRGEPASRRTEACGGLRCHAPLCGLPVLRRRAADGPPDAARRGPVLGRRGRRTDRHLSRSAYGPLHHQSTRHAGRRAAHRRRAAVGHGVGRGMALGRRAHRRRVDGRVCHPLYVDQIHLGRERHLGPEPSLGPAAARSSSTPGRFRSTRPGACRRPGPCKAWRSPRPPSATR